MAKMKSATITMKPETEFVKITDSKGVVVATAKLLYTEGKRGCVRFEAAKDLNISRGFIQGKAA